MEDVFDQMNLSREAALWIARGLRAAAAVDGIHAHEIDLIDNFELDLNVAPHDRGGFEPSAPSPLRNDAERDAFLHSLFLLALADGSISESEDAFIKEVARSEGVDAVRLHKLDRAARMSALSLFRGVKAAREQAVSIGRALGLTEEEIDVTLES